MGGGRLPGYLSIGADGSVVTTPPLGEQWDENSNLRDATPGGSIQAVVEGARLVITATTGGGTSISPQVFSEPKPADYYADDIINVVRFSPDNTLLAAGTGQALEMDSAVNRSNDHAVHVWSTSDWSKRYTLVEPHYSVRALAWSPDGRYLAAAGGLENKYEQFFDSDNLVRVWKIAAQDDGEDAHPSLAFTFAGHTTKVEALAWLPEGNRLVSRDLSGRVVIWRVP